MNDRTSTKAKAKLPSTRIDGEKDAKSCVLIRIPEKYGQADGVCYTAGKLVLSIDGVNRELPVKDNFAPLLPEDGKFVLVGKGTFVSDPYALVFLATSGPRTGIIGFDYAQNTQSLNKLSSDRIISDALESIKVKTKTESKIQPKNDPKAKKKGDQRQASAGDSRFMPPQPAQQPATQPVQFTPSTPVKSEDEIKRAARREMLDQLRPLVRRLAEVASDSSDHIPADSSIKKLLKMANKEIPFDLLLKVLKEGVDALSAKLDGASTEHELPAPEVQESAKAEAPAEQPKVSVADEPAGGFSIDMRAKPEPPKPKPYEPTETQKLVIGMLEDIILMLQDDHLYKCSDGKPYDRKLYQQIESFIYKQIKESQYADDEEAREAIGGALEEELSCDCFGKIASYHAYCKLPFMLKPENRIGGYFFDEKKINNLYDKLSQLLGDFGLEYIEPNLMKDLFVKDSPLFEDATGGTPSELSELAGVQIGDFQDPDGDPMILDVAEWGYTRDGEIRKKTKILLK